MRAPLLLAASLLTGLMIPAATFSQVPRSAIKTYNIPWYLQQNSFLLLEKAIIYSREMNLLIFGLDNWTLLAKTPDNSHDNLARYPLSLKRTANAPIATPEFSNRTLPTTQKLTLIPDPQTISQTIISGEELYHQRLLALKTGELYTRIDDQVVDGNNNWTPKRQPTYEDWKNLLAREAKAATEGQGKNRLSILLGDSLSMWFPKEKLPSGKLWLNQGISGDTSAGILQRLTAFSKTKAEVIYLMVGINDLLRGHQDMSTLHNYRRIIHQLRQYHPHTQIIVQSILPVRVHKVSNSHIRQMNGKIAWIAQQEGAQYLNINDWFMDAAGELRPGLTTDGIHLSSEGYDVWRAAIQQVEFHLSSQDRAGNNLWENREQGKKSQLKNVSQD